MSNEAGLTVERFDIQSLFSIFTKVIALFFIGFTFQYWLMAIGLSDPTFRFDTMPSHWKALVAAFAVLHPIVALGLWGGFRWGLVVWAIAAGTECIIYTLYQDSFGSNETVIFFHLSCCVVFLAYLVARKLETMRRNSTAGR